MIEHGGIDRKEVERPEDGRVAVRPPVDGHRPLVHHAGLLGEDASHVAHHQALEGPAEVGPGQVGERRAAREEDEAVGEEGQQEEEGGLAEEEEGREGVGVLEEEGGEELGEAGEGEG